jgi:hypothetical protein
MRGLDAAERASRKGLPATDAFVKELGPLVREFSPFIEQLEPIIHHFHEYRDNVGTFFSNIVAITNAVTPGFTGDKPIHYARASVHLTPEGLGLAQKRLPTNRANPYALPKAQITENGPIPVFDDRGCGPDRFPTLPPPSEGYSEMFLKNIQEFVLNNGDASAPPCLLQQRPSGGGRFLQLEPLSKKRGGGTP